MKTINEPLTTSEEKSSKTSLFFTAMALSALMVSAVVGGAAFMIYHQFSAMPSGTAQEVSTARGPRTESLPRFAPTRDHEAASPDRSDYRRVDNTVLSPAAARRVIAAWKGNPVVSNVPPPLVKTDAEATQETSNRPPLTEPESRYIVSEHTGRVVGIDGSAGAAAEARLSQSAPAAVAVRMPAPEVRVASPVLVRAAIPVLPGETDSSYQQATGSTDGSQYVPVRRAQPAGPGRSFDAASYFASENAVPVAQGRAVNPTSREAGYRYDFRLPDRASRY